MTLDFVNKTLNEAFGKQCKQMRLLNKMDILKCSKPQINPKILRGSGYKYSKM